jgi:hypothetical protein
MTQRPCQRDEQRRTEQRALVTALIEQLRSSTGWRSWLRARHTFHSYSMGNVLLILHQYPTATRVAGFGAWLKLGYSVRRGEHAIRIWANWAGLRPMRATALREPCRSLTRLVQCRRPQQSVAVGRTISLRRARISRTRALHPR